MVYLYRYLIILIFVFNQACQKKDGTEIDSGKSRPNSQPVSSNSEQEAVNKNSGTGIISVPEPDFRKVSELRLTEVAIDKFKLQDAQIVSIEAGIAQNNIEFFIYDICRTDGDLPQGGPCESIHYYENSVLYPAPVPGSYHVKVLACSRQSLQVGDIICGEDAQTEFSIQTDNRKSKLASSFQEWHELNKRISDLPHKIDQILHEYKNQLKENNIKSQHDDAEKVIDNILKIGPYLHASYFFDKQFFQFRENILQNNEKANLALAAETSESNKRVTSYEYDDNFETQEKSTLGKVMILAGLGTIVLGIAKLNNAIGNLKYDRKMEQIEVLRKDTSAEGVAKVKAAELEASKLNNKTVEGRKRVSRDRKISGGLILGGLVIFATGMGMELTTDTLTQIRSDMMKKIENLENEYLPLINRYHQLNQALGLDFEADSTTQ